MSKSREGSTSRTYTHNEVSAIFGYHPETYRRLAREGRAPVMPIVGTHRYPKAVVDVVVDGFAQIESHTAKAVSAEAT